MGKTLGGSTFIYRGRELDYSFEETIKCLQALCDEVVVCVVESNDGTLEAVNALKDDKTRIIVCSIEEWNEQQGREKLAYFQNKAINFLTTDYNILCQCDEIIHQDSFPAIRQAIETNAEGFFCTRIHLWGNSQYELNVPIERMPCGVNIIRLAKTRYRSVDDGESILAPAVIDFVNDIRIYHVGFIRDRNKHIDKIKHIQDDVFLMTHDYRVDTMSNGFEPLSMGFSKLDLSPIKQELPIFIQKWAKERDEINGFII